MCSTRLRRDSHVLVNRRCRRNSTATSKPIRTRDTDCIRIGPAFPIRRWPCGRGSKGCRSTHHLRSTGRKTLSMHLIDKEGNDTCPLLSINDLRRLRMVIDYEEGKVMFKDSPDVWHKLPTTNKGLMMIPLTKEACERFNTIPPPPKPTTKRIRKKR